MNTRLHTIFGSAFTLIVMSPTEIITILITGALGAIGAFLGSIFIKWIAGLIQKTWNKIFN